MKLLTLLPDDWKGEIDVSKARFAIDENGDLWIPSTKGMMEFAQGNAYYGIVNKEPSILQPEPRPADSIKLSECGGKHIIVGWRNNDTCKAVYSGREWHLSSGVGNVIDHRDDICFLLFNMAVTNIKIYDISQ